MGERDAFWDQVPTDAQGDIVWPEDPDARAALVRSMFGAKVIGALEAVLEEHLEAVDGRAPIGPSPDHQLRVARRRPFADMAEEHWTEVRRLLKNACFGTLYWILVKLEHFPQGNVDFVVEPFDARFSYPAVGIEQTELHHLYFDWLRRWSDHRDDGD